MRCQQKVNADSPLTSKIYNRLMIEEKGTLRKTARGSFVEILSHSCCLRINLTPKRL